MSATRGRPRVAARARLVALSAPGGDARSRLRQALDAFQSEDRLLLVLMMEERLSSREAAVALNWKEAKVARRFAHLVTELRRVLNGSRVRRVARPMTMAPARRAA